MIARLFGHRLGSVPLWAVVAALVILVATTVDVLHRGALTSFDHDVSRRMVAWNVSGHLWAKRAVYVLTLFGQRGTVLVLTVPTVAYLVWRGRSIEPAFRYVAALVAMTVVVYAVKDIVGRTAPTVDLIHTSAGQSYPSGHLANAVLIWGVVAWSARRVLPAGWLVTTLDVIRWLGPICVVVSMTLLDYHWFSDFVAGGCIAVVLLALVTLPVLGAVSHPVDERLRRSLNARGTRTG